MVRGGDRIGYEFKYTDVPKLTASMRIALDDLSLAAIKVIVPGEVNCLLHEKVEVIGLKKLMQLKCNVIRV